MLDHIQKSALLHGYNFEKLVIEDDTILYYDDRTFYTVESTQKFDPKYVQRDRLTIDYLPPDIHNLNFLKFLDLSRITKLTVSSSHVKDISVLSEININNLNMLETQYCLVEVIPILDLPNLKILSLYHNYIRDINFLKESNLPNLEVLNLGCNYISNVEPIYECNFPKLQKASIYFANYQDRNRFINQFPQCILF